MNNFKTFSTPQKSLSDPAAVRSIGYRTGGALAALVLLTYGLQLAVQLAFSYFVPFATEYPVWLVWALSLVPLYGVAFPVFCALLQRVPRVVLPHRKIAGGELVSTVCIAIALLYTGSLLGNGLNLLIGWLKGTPVLSGLEEIVSTTPLGWTTFFTCLIAPLGEEFIFRGLLLNRALVFGEKQAVVFTALAFGLFHGNLYQFFYAFFIGLVLAQLRIKTGSLPLCMGLHALINLLGGVLGQWVMLQGEQAALNFGAAVLTLWVCGLILLCRRWNKTTYARPRPGAKIGWLLASPGALTAAVGCLILMVLALL